MDIFITGTDTDVGKTVITAGFAYAVKSFGYSVGVFKPVQTGSFLKNNQLVSPDLEFIKSADSSILTKASYNLKPRNPAISKNRILSIA